MPSTIASDIAEIKTNVSNLVKSVDGLRGDFEKVVGRVTELETGQARQEERISNFSVFQTTLSVVIGAIASFLGMQKQ